MNQLLTIQDNRIVIKNLLLETLAGAITHHGSLSIQESLQVAQNVSVAGEITADVIKANKIISESGSSAGEWFVSTEEELNGKGLSWAFGNGGVQLVYRTGKRLWSNGDIDLQAEKSYKIDNIPVLSLTELGSQITKSKLREVGALKTLTVTGDSNLSEFAYFSSGLGRLGLNTDQPNGLLSLVGNDVEIVFDSPKYGIATAGTYTNHDLAIITDNTQRILVKNNGDVFIGNEFTKTGNVTIYGTLTVDNLVSDTRIDRFSSLEFKSTKDSTSFGKGLIWTGAGNPKQFILMDNPSRVWSSEPIDSPAFYINGQPALTTAGLGEQVVHSNLSTVGTLTTLGVSGLATFLGDINASRGRMLANVLEFNDGLSNLTITGSKISANKAMSLTVGNDETYYADNNEIVIGNKMLTNRPVKLYGQLSIGITNPASDVDLAVKGDISFGGKKFVSGTGIPTSGSFAKGDICWNNNPQTDNHIGWVCLESGTPGRWAPFGRIG